LLTPVINSVVGLTLSRPVPATGNATTEPGGATYTAQNFQIIRGQYRLQNNGVVIGKREMPLFFDFQLSRNTGTTYQHDTIMGSLNFGAVKNRRDFRALYQFGLKQANSLIASSPTPPSVPGQETTTISYLTAVCGSARSTT